MRTRKSIDVLVVGSLNQDYLVRGKTLPKPGESLLGEEFQISLGGKGANQAIAAARLGAQVAMIGRVGRDEAGDLLREGQKRAGVDCRFITRDPCRATGAALIMVDCTGEKQIHAAPGANFGLSATEVRKAKAYFQQARVVLLQLEIPLAAVMETLRLAKQAGARVVFDPAPPCPLPKKIYRLIEVIRPNSSEAEQLLGVKVKDRASARRAAKRFFELGVKVAALQAGEEGDLLVWCDGEEWLPRLKVKSVDATGAGDAFAAGMAVGLAEGKSYAEAGHLANVTAALATTKVGAQAGLPARQEVDRLLKRRFRVRSGN